MKNIYSNVPNKALFTTVLLITRTLSYQMRAQITVSNKIEVVTYPSIIKAFLMQGSIVFPADTPQGPTSFFSSCILLSAIFADRTVSVDGFSKQTMSP